MHIKKDNFEITNLKLKPELRTWVLSTIEKEFNYKKEFSFEVDFYPLMRLENSENCILLLYNEIPIGHIGTLFRNLGPSQVPICLIGGIAMEKNYQGRGIFKWFFNRVLEELRQKVTFCMLWSDKEDLFKKFGFVPTGILYSSFSKEKLFPFDDYKIKDKSKLTQNEILQLSSLYNDYYVINTFCLNRSMSDWEELLKISSSKLFIQKDSNNNISSYYFYEKGQDLTDIVHEYVPKNGIMNKEFIQSFNVWFPFEEYKELAAIQLPTALVANGYKKVESESLDEKPFFISGLDSI